MLSTISAKDLEMNKYDSHSDSYTDPTTGVLKNKLGITDAAILDKQEADYVLMRSLELAQNPVHGKFDLEHLKAIHRSLFGDIYAWAGEIRNIDISKGTSRFANVNYIEPAAAAIFKELSAENFLAGLSVEKFSDRAAYYLGEINALHPFREGNGRAQREFINHLAYKNGFLIDWKNMNQQEMIQASIESLHGNYSKYAAYILNNIKGDMERGIDR